MIKSTAVAASLTLFLTGFPVCAQETRSIIRPEVALGAQVPDSAETIDAQIDLINAAIEAALGAPSAPPPLSAAEISETASAIRACWNAGSLSRSAQSTTVIVAMDMNIDGRPVSSSIRLVKSSNDDAAATAQAYEAARRAILRCSTEGFKLPPERYEQWKTIEIAFNPGNM